eukprot:18969-Chlamydomonas_euryale.AAC.1
MSPPPPLGSSWPARAAARAAVPASPSTPADTRPHTKAVSVRISRPLARCVMIDATRRFTC